jgi:acylphosphatase
MRSNNLLRPELIGIAVLMSCVLTSIAPAAAKSNGVTAVSGVVTGKVQGVGFRALIQKQAIRYNLAGSAQNNDDESVRFVLQGDEDRIDRAVMTIRDGTEGSANVKVSLSPATVNPTLNTFTVIDWTSLSRGIKNRYNLVFDMRQGNTIIKKKDVKAIRLQICNSVVKNEDVGKCDKNGKDDD